MEEDASSHTGFAADLRSKRAAAAQSLEEVPMTLATGSAGAARRAGTIALLPCAVTPVAPYQFWYGMQYVSELSSHLRPDAATIGEMNRHPEA
jgi:hypothetical protein